MTNWYAATLVFCFACGWREQTGQKGKCMTHTPSETGNPMTEQNQQVGRMNKSILRFACGARLPRNDFLSKPWAEQNHSRPTDSKGRWSVTVWDQAGGIDKPIMPNGSSAQCATDCPKKCAGGRKEHKYIGRHIGANTKWDRSDLRLCITCNPTEEKA